MIQIEKDVPMPQRSRMSDYPFEQMEVGDSFLVTAAENEVKALRGRIGSAAARASAALGRRFSVRVVEGGVRVWREDGEPVKRIRNVGAPE